MPVASYLGGIAVAMALAVTGCQSGGTTTPTDAPASTAITESPRTTPAQRWTMPNLVGANLQQAQDQIQALTGNAIFITTSHDATGRNRNQVADANWKVCSQSIAPGAPITGDTKIDFGAVRVEEQCP